MHMPEILNMFLGDALWALMIYFLVRIILFDWSVRKVGFTGLSFCYLIELSQLYHAEWIDAIRKTTLGALVLGFGFLWSDIIAYSIGISVGVVIDRTLRSFREVKVFS
jgi:hypothetical protein